VDERVSLQIGGGCNNHCAFCEASSVPEPDAAGFAAMLVAARRSGAREVRITGGEPTLRRDLLAALRAAATLGLECVVCTNARMLAYPELAGKLVAAGARRIVVSLLGPDAATHDAIAGAVAFDQTVRGIRNAVASGLRVQADVVLGAASAGQVTSTVALAADLGCAGASVRLVRVGGSSADASRVPPLEQAAAAVERALDEGDRRGLAIGHEGVPCCLLARHRGRETRNPRMETRVRMGPRGALVIRPDADVPLPLPCVGCELQGGCCLVERQVVAMQGAAALFPPAHAVRGVVMRHAGPLVDFQLPGCRWASEGSPKAGVDALVRQGSAGGFELYRSSSPADPTALLHAKNARGYVSIRGTDRLLRLTDECRRCPHLSRCAGCFADERDARAAPSPPWQIAIEGEPPDDPLRWPDFPAQMARLVDRAGKRHVHLRGTAPRVTLLEPGCPETVEPVPATLEPWFVWEAIRRAAPTRLVGYDLPAESPSFRLELEAAAEPARDGKLGTLFIVSECNMDCIMCSVRRFYGRSDDPKRMALPDIFGVIEQYRLLGYTRLDLFGGETTLRPDLPDILRFARGMGFFLDLITNGTLMTASLARELRDSGLHLCMVSLDGPSAETHDRIRRGTQGFARAIAGIGAAVAAGGMEVNVDTVVLPANFDEMIPLAHRVAGLGVTRLNLFLCVEGPNSPRADKLLGRERLIDLYERVLPEMERILAPAGVLLSVAPRLPVEPEGVRELSQTPEFAALAEGVYNLFWRRADVVCRAPEIELLVELRGDVFGCTGVVLFEIEPALGNVYRDKLIDIVNGPAAREFARVAGHTDGCRQCWRGFPDVRPAGSTTHASVRPVGRVRRTT
jgi:MoaA/NifB/PqqE/SkfB family radical SAM enzyme